MEEMNHDEIYNKIEADESLLEDTFLPSNLPLITYLHGRCHIFAQAYSIMTGEQIKFMLDEDIEFGEVLVHAFIEKENGKLLDIRGIISVEEIEYAFDMNTPYIKTVSLNELEENYYKTGFLEKPTEKELNEIKEYIENNFEEEL